MHRGWWLCSFGRRALEGGQVAWAVALGLPSAHSVILDKSFPLSGPQFTHLYNERGDVCWAERLTEWHLVTSRCGVTLKLEDRGSTGPWLGRNPGKAALEKKVSSFVDTDHVKFVESHLGTLGMVVEVGGSDQPAPQIHASPWKPQQWPVYPGPLRERASLTPAGTTISRQAFCSEQGFCCLSSFKRALGHKVLRGLWLSGDREMPLQFPFLHGSSRLAWKLDGNWEGGEGEARQVHRCAGGRACTNIYVSVHCCFTDYPWWNISRRQGATQEDLNAHLYLNMETARWVWVRVKAI